MSRPTITATPENLTNSPQPEFDRDLFNESLWHKGYNVWVEKAIECPCRTEGRNDNLSDCQNCGGLGWVYIDPLETKGIITGINKGTKYREWSEEIIGDMMLTLRDVDNAGFMDRITFLNETNILSEVKRLRTSTSTLENFIYLAYDIESIEDVYVFQSSTQSLVRIPEANYSISSVNQNIIQFAAGALSASTNSSISVRYKHNVQYNILDIPHIIRSSNAADKNGTLNKIKLPNQYIVRLAHYMRRPNFDGTGIISNDTIT